jgi:hypothetical protein
VVVCGLFRSAHRFTPLLRYTLCHLIAATWVLDSVVWQVSESHRPGLEPVHEENKIVSLQTPLEYSHRRKNGYMLSILYVVPFANFL